MNGDPQSLDKDAHEGVFCTHFLALQRPRPNGFEVLHWHHVRQHFHILYLYFCFGDDVASSLCLHEIIHDFLLRRQHALRFVRRHVFVEYRWDAEENAADLVMKGSTHHMVAHLWTSFESHAGLKVSRKFRMEIGSPGSNMCLFIGI